MSVKAAGYVEGYVVARKTVASNGFEWTDNVIPADSYGHAEAMLEVLHDEYSIYAMVEVPMNEYFDAMAYGRLS